MKFGPIPLSEADGAILAHSLEAQGGRLRKGTVLDSDGVERLRAAGHASVIAARLGPDDMSEDEAAQIIGTALASPGLMLGPVFTGRVNLEAASAGVVEVDAKVVSDFNAIDEGLTLATLPDLMRVHEGQLVATVKVIPYGLPAATVSAGKEVLGTSAIRFHPFKGGRAQLILTRTDGFKESLLRKGEDIVRVRIEALGYTLADSRVTAHDEAEVAAALDPTADLILILGASATSDRADVAPAAVAKAGGRIDRFGMPVDPGNLLFLGELKGAPVVGLPGCARSPALNGVDWVLERIAAGIPVDGAAIARMGVGGLLKEMPGRPQPRQPRR